MNLLFKYKIHLYFSFYCNLSCVSLPLVFFFLLKPTLDSCKNCVQIKIIANILVSVTIH